MPGNSTLPTKAEIFSYWKNRFQEIGIFIDWGEPSCWACGFRYGIKYDIKFSNTNLEKILECWEKIPLQRCHIIPRSLGGSDDPSNLFIMCRECHDLAPNTSLPDIFFEWVQKQSHWKRDFTKIDNALRDFDISSQKEKDLEEIFNDPEFENWIFGKIGLHRPQSNYPSMLSRLTPTTIAGLIAHYLKNSINKKS